MLNYRTEKSNRGWKDGNTTSLLKKGREVKWIGANSWKHVHLHGHTSIFSAESEEYFHEFVHCRSGKLGKSSVVETYDFYL